MFYLYKKEIFPSFVSSYISSSLSHQNSFKQNEGKKSCPLCDSVFNFNSTIIFFGSKGRRLRVDQQYNILPADPSTGLGFSMEVIGNKTCPFDVIQAQDFFEIPLQLYPVNSTKGGIIRMSSDLNIFFSDTFTSCLGEYSNFWKVDNYNPSAGKYFITTGGEKGNPGLKFL